MILRSRTSRAPCSSCCGQWSERSRHRQTLGLDAFMCEGFRYGGVNHNLDQANSCAAYPFTELSWDRAHCRDLMGLYLSGWPWSASTLPRDALPCPLPRLTTSPGTPRLELETDSAYLAMICE